MFFHTYSLHRIISFCSTLLVTVTLPFRKACSPTQGLKTMCHFSTSLLVLVSVVSLIKQIQYKLYDFRFGHFLVSLKTELFFLFIFCSFSSCSYLRERSCGGIADYSPSHFFVGGQLDDISHISCI